ncbi:MAG: unsaturated chondroitin disaccharide hydrolase [Psychroserpens sp.]
MLVRVLFLTLVLVTSACGEKTEENQTPPMAYDILKIDPISAQYSRLQILDVASTKYLTYAEKHDPVNGYPISDNNNTQQWSQASLRWSSGFFPGILWQLGYMQADLELLQQAERWTLPLRELATWNGHDLGFLIDNSFGKGSRVQPNRDFDDVRKLAANTLLDRFNQAVGATRSWNDRPDFVVIIDNMMNLALLFDTAKTQGDERYYDAALKHMQTTAREFVRSDGSSYHVVHFSEDNGQVIKKRTAQGASDESTWARGQAWGIYGFSMAYRETGDSIALDTAVKMANYYLNKLPNDGVPNWDFDASGSAIPKDTSAAAIAAVGLWLLGKQIPGQDGSTYMEASKELVNALLNSEYINLDEDKGALLKQATGNKPGNIEVNASLIYADYYLIEALLLQSEIIEWPL